MTAATECAWTASFSKKHDVDMQHLVQEGVCHEGLSSWAPIWVFLQALLNQVHKLWSVMLTRRQRNLLFHYLQVQTCSTSKRSLSELGPRDALRLYNDNAGPLLHGPSQ